MPKFSKAFGRRKSSGNVIDDVQEVPVAPPTFKVFERSDGGSKSFDGGVKFTKVLPTGRPRTSNKLEENMFDHLYNNRGSGASNTNTASTTDNSSRLSAASTAPSSTDISGREDHRSPHDKPFNDIPVPPIPKPASAFTLKSAGRSLSWGRNGLKTSTSPPAKDLPAPPVEPESPQARARAFTASSYASTATPPKLDEKDLGLSLGGDFGEMFSGFDKRKSAVMQQQDIGRAISPETSILGPASRSYVPHRNNQPSPLHIDKSMEIEASPYSWGSHHSHDGLMSNSSPPPFAPRTGEPSPPVPQHYSPAASRQQTDSFGNTGLRPVENIHRKSTADYDEDARLLRESVNASRKMDEPSYSPQVRNSWALPSDTPYKIDEATSSNWGMGSTKAIPITRKGLSPSPSQEDGLFDSHIAASASLAERFQEQPLSPPKEFTPRNKVMTPAQFERYKQDQERLKSVGGKPKYEEDDDDERYDDDVDDADKAKQVAKQRRKQEAHMAVYRQQMMKVTGEQPTAGPSRPAMFSSQSTPNLANFEKPEEGEEEDEEVPLAILQAHGFPNKGKPPMRSMGSNPNLRAQSLAVGGDGRLPVFARNLPQEPHYYGAGIVNSAQRESLAFGGGSSSVGGASSRGLPPGGLVGVIATEERSRAMRRGSPNPQGEYGPIPAPSNGFNGMGMPSPGMMNGMGPMGMNPMMMTPGDQAQMQMSQQMQQFMQMQMQFMQMMTNGQGPPQQNGQMLQPPMGQGQPGAPSIRPGSSSLRPGSSHQRPTTMLDPNAAPWLSQGSMFAPSINISGGGYAPSIAPSERSNVGLPGRYRPVSHMPPPDSKSRTSTMSGALQNWENKTGSTTIKPVKQSGNVSDEDDEQGWEEMAKKREKKKSVWREKRDTNGFKDLLGLSQQL